MSNNTQRLIELFGFDPAKRENPTKDLLTEVLGDLKKERSEKAKVLAKTQLTEAVQLREQMYKLEKEFEGARAKFDKQLGKILNVLEASLNGRQPPAEPAEAETPASE